MTSNQNIKINFLILFYFIKEKIFIVKKKNVYFFEKNIYATPIRRDMKRF